MDPRDIQSVCSRLGIKPSQALGQHFLVDTRVFRKIIEAAQLLPASLVLEIGPGPGTLTRELSHHAGTVYAVELDKRWASFLRGEFADVRSIHIEHADIFQWFTSYRQLFPDGKYTVVANLPYQISSHVLHQFLSLQPRPRLMVVLLQKEVAERATAKPGATSVLSIMAQVYSTPRVVMQVPRKSFWPAPEVDSAVVSFEKIGWKLAGTDERDFFRVVKAGFSARRKKLINNLASVLRIPKQVVGECFSRLRLSDTVRAQELSIEQWGELAERLKE